ncbi:MAG TPA: tyrosine--tRNA ligase [Vicinamibacteria bacterium]
MSALASPEEAFAHLTRRCVDVVTADALRQKLARGKPLTVKVGFDPTAPDIHLGHTILMRKMRHFQDLGHQVVFVIGDFTAMIGDPTGKSKTRPALSPEEIERNAETYKAQAFKILDRSKTKTRLNSEWLGALGAEGLIRLAARYNVARMLERREFKQRYEAGQPISLHEFLYPLAQAYDSVALEADVELGGTDQLFNLNVGRDIMPGYGLEPQVVLTTPLLEGTDGVEKMSKSLGNYIGVAETPSDMFAKVMSISDELMWKYYALLTDLSPSALDAEKAKGQPMVSKLGLGARLVGDFHGEAQAREAEVEWRRVHQQRQAPSDLRVVELMAGSHKIRELLVAIGLAPSKSEAERLFRARAVRWDGAVLESPQVEIDHGGSAVVSVGPARHVRITVPSRG